MIKPIFPRAFGPGAVVASIVALIFAGLWLKERKTNQVLQTELRMERTHVVVAPRPAAPPPLRPAQLPAVVARTRRPVADAQRALAHLLRTSSWRTNDQTLQDIVDSIAAGELPQMLAWTEGTLRGETRRVLRFKLLQRWAHADPASAIAWTNASLSGRDRAEFRQMISDWWAETDPVAALRGAGPSPNVFRHLAATAPDTAAHHALTIAPGDQRTMAVTIVADSWFSQDPEAAIRWIASLSSPGDQFAALRAVMIPLIETDPRTMADYVAALPDSEPAATLGRDFIGRWILTNPDAAATWVLQLPPGSRLQAAALPAVVEQWAGDDPLAAGRWIDSLPPGAAHESATQTYIRRIAGSEPQLAMNWVNKLTDAAAKSRITVDVLHEWQRSDPEAAARWLAQSGLTPAQKQAVTGYQ